MTNTTDPWTNHIESLNEMVADIERYDNFLRDQTIIGTMFVGNCPMIDAEYKYLIEDDNYQSQWRYALIEEDEGNPIRYDKDPTTSGNRIHCCYHLAQFQNIIKKKISSLYVITELGGGYGCMADVCYKAGFIGKYTIFDLPVLNVIQDHYCNHLIPLGFTTVNDIDTLEKIISKKNGMIISTWALSEMPKDLRDRLMVHSLKYQYLLLAFQSAFEKMDIWTYFDKVVEEHPEYSWQNYMVPTMNEEHKYLFGYNYYL